MKKSTKIQLVLITAALASCNRVIIPADSQAGYRPDPTLAQQPLDTSSTCNCTENHFYNDDSMVYPYNGFYTNFSLYFPGAQYRRGFVWRSHQFIQRGGFGKNSFSAAS